MRHIYCVGAILTAFASFSSHAESCKVWKNGEYHYVPGCKDGVSKSAGDDTESQLPKVKAGGHSTSKAEAQDVEKPGAAPKRESGESLDEGGVTSEKHGVTPISDLNAILKKMGGHTASVDTPNIKDPKLQNYQQFRVNPTLDRSQ